MTYTSDAQSASVTSGKFGVLTYTFSGDNAFSFVVGDTLKVSINAVNNVAHTQYGTFQGQTGVSNLSYGTVSGWQTSVKLSGTVAASVPEPATATLSLLALAGLAARRRRK
ncbi:MAG: PEP-CTERM sorting domain-containing protein [Akkermansia sp.]|nr:PEP-CTERM sorting domain-containing protein [Akkermansia sp.]